MSNEKQVNSFEILLVEDNPGDARLIVEALKKSKIITNIQVVRDGLEAFAFLKRKEGFEEKSRPDLILLDLNIPEMDGHEFLEKIKEEDSLKKIPIVVLAASHADEDIMKSYKLHANSYITKPVDNEQFIKVVQSIANFWFTIVKLPKEGL
jgi:two-component system response regulator